MTLYHCHLRSSTTSSSTTETHRLQGMCACMDSFLVKCMLVTLGSRFYVTTTRNYLMTTSAYHIR